MRNLVLGLSAIALAAMGCDGGDTPDPMTDAGGNPGTDAGMMMGTDAGSNPGTDAGPGGDGNDSFATAQDASSGEVMGRISPAGDVDFYSFTGTAGQWLIVATEANPEDMDGMVDTVVTLFDSGMNQIAENDDAVPRVSTDSEIISSSPFRVRKISVRCAQGQASDT